jgi:2-amino-4-hydroxy-6-hydroxymethyldihydropteridine diphosphokinase
MSTLALIGLGSNLGDRKATLDAAVAALAATPGVDVRAVSSYHVTEPVGGPGGQPAYLNAAVALETTLDPLALHGRLRAIEAEAGRVRRVRWGERTLDLDLLTFGDRILDTPGLSIPHPRMAVRRFVLAPVAEIAPDEIEPITLRTMSELLANLDRRPSFVDIAALDHPEGAAIVRRVARDLGVQPLLPTTTENDLESIRRDAGDLAASLELAARHEDRWIVSGADIPGRIRRWRDEKVREVRRTGVPRDRRAVERDQAIIDSFPQTGGDRPHPTFCVFFPEGWGRDSLLGSREPVLLFSPRADPSEVAEEMVACCRATRS